MSADALHVAVFGAGIGGLTVAHELAERGRDATVRASWAWQADLDFGLGLGQTLWRAADAPFGVSRQASAMHSADSPV